MSTDPHRVRASDAEREQFAQVVRTAMTEGRLTLEEGEERMAQVYGARFRDELAPLTRDLPDSSREALYDNPEARTDARRGMRRHVGFAVAVTAVLVGLWLLSGAHFFWPAIPLFFITMGLFRHLRWQRGSAATGGGRPGWGGGPGWGGPPWAGRGHRGGPPWASYRDDPAPWNR
jgi:hypothetical protein